MRTMITPLVLAILLACCLIVHQARAAADATQPGKPRLQWSLVAAADEKGDVIEVDDPGAPGGKLRVLKEAFLDERGIESAEVTKDQGRTAVSLKMTKEGAERVSKVTGDNVNRRVAVVFDGRVVFAPVIRSKIGDAAMITGGPDGLSDKDAKAIVGAVRAARDEETKQKEVAPSAK